MRSKHSDTTALTIRNWVNSSYNTFVHGGNMSVFITQMFFAFNLEKKSGSKDSHLTLACIYELSQISDAKTFSNFLELLNSSQQIKSIYPNFSNLIIINQCLEKAKEAKDVLIGQRNSIIKFNEQIEELKKVLSEISDEIKYLEASRTRFYQSVDKMAEQAALIKDTALKESFINDIEAALLKIDVQYSEQLESLLAKKHVTSDSLSHAIDQRNKAVIQHEEALTARLDLKLLQLAQSTAKSLNLTLPISDAPVNRIATAPQKPKESEVTKLFNRHLQRAEESLDNGDLKAYQQHFKRAKIIAYAKLTIEGEVILSKDEQQEMQTKLLDLDSKFNIRSNMTRERSKTAPGQFSCVGNWRNHIEATRFERSMSTVAIAVQ